MLKTLLFEQSTSPEIVIALDQIDINKCIVGRNWDIGVSECVCESSLPYP